MAERLITISLDRRADARIAMWLATSSSGRVVVPGQIAIPAGSASVVTSISFPNNFLWMAMKTSPLPFRAQA